MLYIVSTPIGNLRDITLRALDTLKEVDFILCEDTRVTKKLLAHFGIEKPLISYHQHSRLQKTEQILQFLREGESLALVSDVGTPGISDPGNELIAKVFEVKLQTEVQTEVVPIPGPSAITAIASIAGFPMDRFLFLGFPPAKKGRNKFFQEIAQAKYPVIFYESPHRIIKTLQELQARYTPYNIPRTQIVVGRELTKKFETVYRGTVPEALKQLESTPAKGEFVVIISGN